MKYNGLKRKKRSFNCRTNNCYTYAMNQYVNPFTKKEYEDYNYCQPGNIGGNGYGRTNGKFTNMIDLVTHDMDMLGYEFKESTLEEYSLVEGSWKVALCYSPDIFEQEYYNDYHWYRQGINGTWTHKNGRRAIQEADEAGETIYDPKICDRGRYTKFVGYFMIIPKAKEQEIEMIEEIVA